VLDWELPRGGVEVGFDVFQGIEVVAVVVIDGWRMGVGVGVRVGMVVRFGLSSTDPADAELICVFDLGSKLNGLYVLFNIVTILMSYIIKSPAIGQGHLNWGF
jgi:hypothetical protein